MTDETKLKQIIKRRDKKILELKEEMKYWKSEANKWCLNYQGLKDRIQTAKEATKELYNIPTMEEIVQELQVKLTIGQELENEANS